MLDGSIFPFFSSVKWTKAFPSQKNSTLETASITFFIHAYLIHGSLYSSNVVIRVPRIYLPCFGIMLDDIVMFIKYRPFYDCLPVHVITDS